MDTLWINATQARRLCGFGEKKFRRLVREGVIPSWVDPGTVELDADGQPIPGTGTRYFSPAALEAWARKTGAAA